MTAEQAYREYLRQHANDDALDDGWSARWERKQELLGAYVDEIIERTRK